METTREKHSWFRHQQNLPKQDSKMSGKTRKKRQMEFPQIINTLYNNIQQGTEAACTYNKGGDFYPLSFEVNR